MDTENAEAKKAAETLQLFGHRLQALVNQQISDRAVLETRWQEDLDAYLGTNDSKEETRLRAAGKSTVAVNITRNKTNAAEARLSDLLFPTDSRNWGIKPTPDPNMDDVLAKDKAEKMEKAIDDQLTEAKYNEKGRAVIRSACIYGTGVMKAPVVVGQCRKSWQINPETGDTALQVANVLQPGVEYIDIWDFFPDMAARNIDEAEFCFERRLMTPSQMREFARQPGVLPDQARLAFEAGPKATVSTGDNAVRTYSGVSANNDKRFEVWEYHGEIDKEELSSAMGGEEYDDDPLNATTGVVTFCNNIVLRVAINPLDTDDHPYSVFCYEEDPGNIFGIGVPRIMREPAKVMKAAWRMALDNAGICAGDQICIDKNAIKPADGDWTITARKLWYKEAEDIPMNNAFATFAFQSHQGELMDLFTRARQLADEETNLPLIAQGEQTNSSTHTARGMSMLLNAATVVQRRQVRGWDDDITTTVIGRFYDWNMQYNDDPEIKGDFEVDARGSSELAEQAAADQGIERMLQLIDHPKLGRRLDGDVMLRKYAKALRVDPDELVLKDQPEEQQPDPMQSLEGMKLQLEQAKLQLKDKELQMNYELKQMELALREDITLAQLQAKMETDARRDKTQRDVAAIQEMSKQNEMEFKRETGMQGI